MSSLSPAATRIVDAAIAHFAVRGYDGASLTEIAEAVGIRKASLYAHFSSKDSLFLQAFSTSIGLERVRAAQCFADEAAEALPGSHYCQSLITCYPQSSHLQFFLRTSYMPPAALVARIDEEHEAYLAQLGEAFIARLKARDSGRRRSKASVAQHVEAYLGIVDSLQVKLIYTDPDGASRRLEALLALLQRSLVSA